MDGFRHQPEARVNARTDPVAGRSAATRILQEIWTHNASDGLADSQPRASARTGGDWGLALALTILLGLVSLGFILAPQFSTLVFGTACCGLFTALIGFRLAACVLPPPRQAAACVSDGALPRAAILVPAYREAAILPHLIASLAQIDYPDDRLDICLVLEASDRETLAIARAMDLPRGMRIIEVPPGTPQTKPRALNYALRHVDCDLVTILDAEDRPHPGQLRAAACAFLAAPPSLACIQAPLNWYNRDDSWITRQFVLEYAAHFNVFLPLLVRLGWPIPLGGTSNYFRIDALRAAGGWDAYNVTEDADLGFRLAKHGYHCGLINLPTLEEAPARAWPWIRQRTRWLKGYTQTILVQLRDFSGPRRGLRALSLSATLLAALLSALVHAPLTLLTLVYLSLGWSGSPLDWLAAAFLASGYGVAGLATLIGQVRAGIPVIWSDLLGLPLYWPLQTIAAFRALWELVARPYFWDKTEHGLSDQTQCISASPPP